MSNIFYLFLIPVWLFGETATGEWDGLRTALRDQGFEVKGELTVDDTWNLGGGKRSTKGIGAIEYLLNIGAEIDTEYYFHHKGGTLFFNFEAHGGRDPTDDVGSYNVVDNIEAPTFAKLYECWYKETFAKNFWLLVGKTDAWNFFTQTPHSQIFMNGALTRFPTIPLPTYPYTRLSLITSFPVRDFSALQLGFYEGLQNSFFCIGQWDFFFDGGILSLGGFGSTLNGGTFGPYCMLDQIFYKDACREAAFFAFYSFAKNPSAFVDHYFAFGLDTSGFARACDHIGLCYSRSQFQGGSFTEPFEASLEAYYQWLLTPAIYLLPDFQYIIHPGGEGLPNATIFSLRFELKI